ncbi:MAG: MFS transporter, partial [Pseudomonadota bacterium]
RRGWLILSQILLLAAIGFAGFLDPLTTPWWMALAAVLIAFASATQDIVIDAFRVESLDGDQQAAGMANYVAAYRFGLLFSSAGALILVDWFEKSLGLPKEVIWNYAYWLMAGLVLVGVAGVLLSSEPEASAAFDAKLDDPANADQNRLQRLFQTAFHAFADFLQKPLAITILLFVIFFKLCDSFAGVMTTPFVVDLGFERTEYAALVKGVGFATALIGGFAGGLLARALPLVQCLWIAGVLQAASNLVFAWLAWMGQSQLALGTAIAVENLTGGVGTVVFVAYISSQTSNAAHTATQFALLTSLAAVGRTYISAASGYVAEQTGWFWFFVVTVLAAIPGFMLLAWLQWKGHFRDLEASAEVRTDGEPA